MSFEASLFRIHEKTLATCAAIRGPRTLLTCCSLCCLVLSGLAAGALAAVHALIVNRVGCVGFALSSAVAAWPAAQATGGHYGVSAALPAETVFRIRLVPPENSSSLTSAFATLARAPLPSGVGTGELQSNSSLYVWSASSLPAGSLGPAVWTQLDVGDETNATSSLTRRLDGTTPRSPHEQITAASSGGHADDAVVATGSAWVPAAIADVVAEDAYFSPDYLLSARSEPVTMGQGARARHRFPVVNLTVPILCGEIDAGSPLPMWLLATLVDSDALVVNALQWTFPWQGGFLLSANTGEIWSWGSVQQAWIDYGWRPQMSTASVDVTEGTHTLRFTAPLLTSNASSALRGVLHLFSRGGTLLLAVFAYYCASTSAALMLRALFLHGGAAIFAVLAAVDGCRRPNDTARGLCACCFLRGPRRRRARGLPPAARTCVAVCPAAFGCLIACSAVFCCPCCDVLTPADSRYILPASELINEDGDDTDDGGDHLAGEELQRMPEAAGGRRGDAGEIGLSREGGLAAPPSNWPTALDVHVHTLQGTPVAREDSVVIDARSVDPDIGVLMGSRSAAGGDDVAHASAGSRAPRLGGVNGAGDRRNEATDALAREVAAARRSDDHLLDFAWASAGAMYGWIGRDLLQQRREGELEEARLRLTRRRAAGALATVGEASLAEAVNVSGRQSDHLAAATNAPPGASTGEPARHLDGSAAHAVPSTATLGGRDSLLSRARADAESRGTSAASRVSQPSARPARHRRHSDATAGDMQTDGVPAEPEDTRTLWGVVGEEAVVTPAPPQLAGRWRSAAAAVASLLPHTSWWRMSNREHCASLLAHLQAVLWPLLGYVALVSVLGSGVVETKSHPAGLAVSMWAVVLLAEYASLLFARTRATMLLLSRVSFWSFLAVFVYWSAWSYPPMDWALTGWFFLLSSVILLCLAQYEAPALAAGRVSALAPRELMCVEGAGRAGRSATVRAAADASAWVEDGSSGWALMTGMPQAHSLFLPLTTPLSQVRASTVYDAAVPARSSS